MFPFPPQRDATNQKVFVAESCLNCWIPFLSFLVCSPLYMLATAIYISFQKDIERIEILMQVFICWSLSTAIYIFTLLVMSINEFIKFFNQVLQMDKQFENGNFIFLTFESKVYKFFMQYLFFRISPDMNCQIKRRN